ncbi:unnamed protein product, partial [Ectocarpus sp. 12 AP-2014]
PSVHPSHYILLSISIHYRRPTTTTLFSSIPDSNFTSRGPNPRQKFLLHGQHAERVLLHRRCRALGSYQHQGPHRWIHECARRRRGGTNSSNAPGCICFTWTTQRAWPALTIPGLLPGRKRGLQ